MDAILFAVVMFFVSLLMLSANSREWRSLLVTSSIASVSSFFLFLFLGRAMG